MSSHGRSLDILTKRRIRDLINSAAGPDDEVKFVLQNANGWAFVALQDRVVIARAGMAAGATFGGQVSQFLYQDIINVAQNMGMMTAVIEIHTPAHQGNAVGDFWTGLTSTGGTSKSPFEADNAFPCNRAELKEWQPYLEELNGYIRQARTRATQPPPSGDGLGDQLAKLAELHASGALSDAEFEAAKARLLSG